MASTLRSHWSTIFTAKGIDEALLERWLDEDLDNRPASESQPFPRDAFKLKKKHIRYAILNAKNTAPGPDGIPFWARSRAPGLSAEILHEAARFFRSGQGAESMAAEYQDFNFSLLFFLPKKASGTCPTGEGIYEPANVRPLNVTNTDNRLLSNAVRMAIEKHIGPRVP